MIFSDAGLRRSARPGTSCGGLGWIILTRGDWRCVAIGQFVVALPSCGTVELEVNRLELQALSGALGALATLCAGREEEMRRTVEATFERSCIRTLRDRVVHAAGRAAAAGVL